MTRDSLPRVMLALWALMSLVNAADMTPLSQSGAGSQTVLAALSAWHRGDRRLLDQLPRELYDKPPALADPTDPTLGRRWTELLTPATSPPPAAVARAFERGWLVDVLLLAPADPRATAARTLLGLDRQSQPTLPALPVAHSGPLPPTPPARLVHEDGWLFGLDATGAISWQRQVDRQARVICGLVGALVAQTDGLAWIGLHGERRLLPPLPAFARPLATHGQVAWFQAGAQTWHLDLTSGTVQPLLLPDIPLGPPLMRGESAWWLTATSLITTRGAHISERLPHLLALAHSARLQSHPHGAIIRDGNRWWLVVQRHEAPLIAQAEAWLLAKDRQRASALLSQVDEPPDDLRVRIRLNEPRTPQQAALVALAQENQDFSHLIGNPVLTELSTDLTLPWTAWPHQVTLTAWQARNLDLPQITLQSDGVTVLLRATWSQSRWWQRHWPSRPLLDAPSRSWALIPGAVVVVEGAGHLLACDERTGTILLTTTLPFDFDPAHVTREATSLVIERPQGMVRVPFEPPARR